MASDGTIKINTELESSKAQSALSKFSSTAKTALKGVITVASAAGAAVAAIGGYAVKVGSDFEAGMSKVSAISGATGEDLDALTEKAKEMGAKTKFSATEAASAFEYMAMAGWKTEDMLDGIEGIMNLAAASGVDLATTSDIVTDALTAFGLSASDSGHFADVLAQASANANTNVDLMGETFKYVAPVAGALGFSVEDTATAIGLMANAGIKGSQAGTALRSIMSRMSKPTDEVAEAMSSLGVSLTNDQGKMKTLGEIMGDLRNGFDGLSEAEAAQMAAALGGQEAMSGLLAIVNASDADFEKLQTAIYNCDGATEKMAQTMQDNLQGSLTILGSAAEGFGIQVYESVQSPLKEAADYGTECVNRLTSAFESGGLTGVVKKAGDIFNEMATKAASSSDVLAGIITPMKNVVNHGKSLAETVLPKAAKAFETLAKHGTTTLSVLAAGAAAMKTYSSAMKTGASITKALTAAKKANTIAEKAGTIQTAAANGQLTISQYLMAVRNKQLTAGAAATGLLTKAQLALNTAMKSNAIGLIITGIAGLVAGITAYKLATDDSTKSTGKLSDKQKELIENSKNTIEQIKEEAEARQKSIDTATAEIDSAQTLWTELQKCVDENGKIKEGYEARAQYIVGELADALGIEIELVDGQIQKYDELSASIEDVMAKKKAEAVLDAMKSEYTDAMQEQAGLAADLAAKYDALTESKRKQKDIEAQIAEEAKNATTVYDEMGNAYEINTQKYFELQNALKEVNGELEVNQQLFDEASAKMADNEKVISDYNALLEASMSGNTETINNTLAQIQSGIDTTLEASSKAALEQAETTGSTLLGILSAQEQGLATLEQSTIDGTAEAMGIALSTISTSSENMKALLEDAGVDGSAKMLAAMAEADLSGNLSQQAQAGLEGFEELKNPAQDGVDAFIDSLREALEVHSPSRAVAEIFEQVWPGACEGLESGQEELNTKGKGAIQKFLESIGADSFSAKAREIGSNLMSFFGLGVSSQNKNMNSTGQAGAEAAKEGAESVDLTPTGENAGEQYASGIGAKIGRARSSGESIAKEAEAGASTGDGYKLGSDFGEGYADGISSWASEVAGRAASIATGAVEAVRAAQNSGSPSKKTRKLGHDFDDGYALGISDNEDEIAESSAQIAETALSALDMDTLTEKLKSIDVPEVMARINTSIDEQQSHVSDRIVAATEAKERISMAAERAATTGAPEIDYKRLGREMSKRPIYVSSTLNGRELVSATAVPMERKMKENELLKKMLNGER